MIKAAIYIRVSTEDQAKEGYSSGRLHTGKIFSTFFQSASDMVAARPRMV